MIFPPITLNPEGGNVIPLNATFKKVETERQFKAVPHSACQHYSEFVTYVIDEKLAEVTCGGCGEKLNAMWVLGQLMNKESRHARFRETYQAEMKRLRERSRTKCRHCGEMTTISS